jgi:hypothetical protein
VLAGALEWSLHRGPVGTAPERASVVQPGVDDEGKGGGSGGETARRKNELVADPWERIVNPSSR